MTYYSLSVVLCCSSPDRTLNIVTHLLGIAEIHKASWCIIIFKLLRDRCTQKFFISVTKNLWKTKFSVLSHLNVDHRPLPFIISKGAECCTPFFHKEYSARS